MAQNVASMLHRHVNVVARSALCRHTGQPMALTISASRLREAESTWRSESGTDCSILIRFEDLFSTALIQRFDPLTGVLALPSSKGAMPGPVRCFAYRQMKRGVTE